MILLFPSTIKFDSKEARDKFAPECHMFYGQRCVDVPDGIMKWEGMSEDSELIEDTSEEDKKVWEKKKKEKEQEEKEKEKDGDEKEKSEKVEKKDDGKNGKKKADDADSEREKKRQKIGGEEKHYDLR